jgi:hypothetical protein
MRLGIEVLCWKEYIAFDSAYDLPFADRVGSIVSSPVSGENLLVAGISSSVRNHKVQKVMVYLGNS